MSFVSGVGIAVVVVVVSCCSMVVDVVAVGRPLDRGDDCSLGRTLVLLCWLTLLRSELLFRCVISYRTSVLSVVFAVVIVVIR